MIVIPGYVDAMHVGIHLLPVQLVCLCPDLTLVPGQSLLSLRCSIFRVTCQGGTWVGREGEGGRWGGGGGGWGMGGRWMGWGEGEGGCEGQRVGREGDGDRMGGGRGCDMQDEDTLEDSAPQAMKCVCVCVRACKCARALALGSKRGG